VYATNDKEKQKAYAYVVT